LDRNETFPALPVSSLIVQTAWASVDIRTEDVDDIQLLVSGSEQDVKELRVSLKGSELTIEQPHFGLPPKIVSPQWMQLTLRLPRTWKGSIAASTISAPLTACGLSGSDLALESVSGRIEARELCFIAAKVRTVSGPVTVEALDALTCKAHTVSGEVSLALLASLQRAEAASVAGNVILAIPFAQADAALRSVSGKLRTENVSIAPGTPVIRVATVSGNLDIRQNNLQ